MTLSMWHTDFLVDFNNELYKGVLTYENIVSNEINKKYKKRDYFGYILERDYNKTKTKERFFLPTQFIDALPIVITEAIKFSDKSEVFKFIKGCETRKIPTRKAMSFRKLVDSFADYSHSEDKHWKLSKIIILAGYFERINIRIVSEASFGKDALVDILSLLNGNVVNLYDATLAKLKFSLKNDFIVVNELGGLTNGDISKLQSYLTQAGAYKPKYENNSRSVKGTKEVMDLKNKTHIVFHNIPSYYQDKDQKYFEQMFTEAILDRFPALLMKGYVTENFSKSPKLSSISDNLKNKLKDIITTINYYKANSIKKDKYFVKDGFWGFKGKEKQRSLRGFNIISKYISEYSNSESEFLEWCYILKKSREDYITLVKAGIDVETYLQ